MIQCHQYKPLSQIQKENEESILENSKEIEGIRIVEEIEMKRASEERQDQKEGKREKQEYETKGRNQNSKRLET